MSKLQVYPFRPALQGLLAARFYRCVSAAISSGDAAVIEAFETIVSTEVAWASKGSQLNPVQRLKYRAVWLLLRDLQRIGWALSWKRNTLFLTQPEQSLAHLTVTDIKHQKQLIRNAMSHAKADKIAQCAEFIDRMNSTIAKGMVSKPISALIADGVGLSRDLRRIASNADPSQRAQLLAQCVQPYLQLVEEKKRCSHTGHLLSDIWRYFRFTWASPPESTPGRTLLYLVRDAARPNHPVMGIFALENSPILIRCRDHELGWTIESFLEGMGKLTLPQQRAHIQRAIGFVDGALDEVDTRGLCTSRDMAKPSEAIICKLSEIARRADAHRGEAVRRWQTDESLGADRAKHQSDLGNISKSAERALYRRKRAEKLVRLLSAKRYLVAVLLEKNPGQFIRDSAKRESDVSALRNFLVSVKSKHIGTSILELNVCGAIPPYNHVLGGKLCALLALSPTVAGDYRKRYGDRPSDIASRIKGKPVIRPADLLYVGTSSLYVVGSSQYNRLKLPADLFPRAGKDVTWRRLGETQGFGTLHIGRDTVAALDEIITRLGNRRANHVFGEGASPKFRKVRAGIEVILENGLRETVDAVARHEMRRIVYGAWLAENGHDITTGLDNKPKFYYAGLRAEEGTRRIVQYWTRRWLSMRLDHSESLDAVRSFSPQSLQIQVDKTAPTDGDQDSELVSVEGEA